MAWLKIEAFSKKLTAIIAIAGGIGLLGGFIYNSVVEYQNYQEMKKNFLSLEKKEQKTEAALDSLDVKINRIQKSLTPNDQDVIWVGIFVKDNRIWYNAPDGQSYRVLFSSDGQPYYIDGDGISNWCW